MAETPIKRYERLKQAVAQQREHVAELRGRKSSLTAQLREQFECDTVEEAESKLRKARTKLGQLESTLGEMLDGLESAITGSR